MLCSFRVREKTLCRRRIHCTHEWASVSENILPDDELDQSHYNFVEDEEEINHQTNFLSHLTQNDTERDAEAYDTCKKYNRCRMWMIAMV